MHKLFLVFSPYIYDKKLVVKLTGLGAVVLNERETT